MRRSPRPTDAPLLDRNSTRFIVAAGSMKALVALAILAVLPQLGFDLDTARAAAFHYLAIGQLLVTYPSRWTSVRPLPNWKLHAVVLIGIGVQVAAAYVPFVAALLGNAALPGRLWLLVLPAAMTTALLAAGVASAIWRTEQPAGQPEPKR